MFAMHSVSLCSQGTNPSCLNTCNKNFVMIFLKYNTLDYEINITPQRIFQYLINVLSEQFLFIRITMHLHLNNMLPLNN